MRKFWSWWVKHQVWVRWAATLALAVYAVTIAQDVSNQQDAFEADRKSRTKESCNIITDNFYNKVRDVMDGRQSLDQTRTYLRNGKLGPGLTAAIKVNLPKQKEDLRRTLDEAIDAHPPSYCSPPDAAVPYPRGR